MSTRVNLLG